jgi:3-hydroxybutyryl-CoA dehydrogenase
MGQRLQAHVVTDASALYAALSSDAAPWPMNPVGQPFDLVIDLSTHPADAVVMSCPVPLLVSGVTHSLAWRIRQSGCGQNLSAPRMAFNTWPGFVESESWEVSVFDSAHQSHARRLFEALGIPVQWVADQAGMVTPRVLVQIINEAFFLLQEKGATVADIDSAMRLGVNYPKGPFEWAQQIGLNRVLRTLEALNTEKPTAQYIPSRLLRAAALGAPLAA